MEYYVYHDPGDVLYHWGVKGMKWGVRRYQNKDGSLTAAGKKRRAKLEEELEKLGGGKKKESDESSERKKTVGEMSNKELQEHTTRMQLEKNYYDAQRQLATAMPPKKVSAGQKFANKMLNDVITPALTNAGKNYLEKMIKDKAGIKDDVKINWDDMIKKQTYEKNERDKVYQDLKRENDINQEKDRADARNEKRAEAKKKADSNSKSDSVSDKSDTSSSNAKDKKNTNQEKKSSEKVHEGTVEGTGTYKKSNSEPKQSSKNETVIDAEWSEVPVSDVPSSVATRGQSYVTALLEAPKELDD